MVVSVFAVLTVFGINIALWGTIGLVRLVDETVRGRRARRRARRARRAAAAAGEAAGDDETTEDDEADDTDEGDEGDEVDETAGPEPSRSEASVAVADVAVLIPAHDEELVIADTVRAIGGLVPLDHVHVVSDGSSDATAAIARAEGAQVMEVTAGGKAAALEAGIEAFDLIDRFRAVLLLDADTRLDPGYFDAALPLFDDPGVVAVAGSASTMWNPRWSAFAASVLNAHRERMYVLFQHCVKYGQTWRYTNVSSIVPGFASMYRTEILRTIDINPPGLVIEDFNMTFEVHHQRLGRIGYTPRAVAYTQDPQRLHDYYMQVRRWALGFWQTCRRHRFWFGKFWTSLLLMIAEIVTSSIALFIALSSLFLVVLGALAHNVGGGLGPLEGARDVAAARIGPATVLLGVVLPDYLLTCVTAWHQRRPSYLFYGLFFLPLRILDGVAAMIALIRSWGPSSTGRWVSPSRVAIAPLADSQSPREAPQDSH